jgi:hypothetical protein
VIALNPRLVGVNHTAGGSFFDGWLGDSCQSGQSGLNPLSGSVDYSHLPGSFPIMAVAVFHDQFAHTEDCRQGIVDFMIESTGRHSDEVSLLLLFLLLDFVKSAQGLLTPAVHFVE